MKALKVLFLLIASGLAVITGRNVYIMRDATLFTADKVTFSTWFPYVVALISIGILSRSLWNRQWVVLTFKLWPVIHVSLICAGFLTLGFLFLFLYAPLNFTGEVIAASYFLTALIIDRKNIPLNFVLFVVNGIIAALLIERMTTDYIASLF